MKDKSKVLNTYGRGKSKTQIIQFSSLFCTVV